MGFCPFWFPAILANKYRRVVVVQTASEDRQRCCGRDVERKIVPGPSQPHSQVPSKPMITANSTKCRSNNSLNNGSLTNQPINQSNRKCTKY